MHNQRCEWISGTINHYLEYGTSPSPPEYKDLIYGISFLKDALDLERVVVSDNCEKLIKETELYAANPETGVVDKRARRLVNCLRFQLPASGLNWDIPLPDPEEPALDRFIKHLNMTLEDHIHEQSDGAGHYPDFGYLDTDEFF
jgi:hypothetical protein